MESGKTLTLRSTWHRVFVEIAWSAFFAAIAAHWGFGLEPTEGGLWLILGVAVLAFLAQLPRNSNYLELDPTGFRIRIMYRTTRYEWNQVVVFGTMRVFLRRTVGFNFSSEYKRLTRLRRMFSWLAEYEAGLPETYGRSAEELSDIMNLWRRKYGGA